MEHRTEVAAEVRAEVHHGPQVVHRPIDESDLDRDAVKIVHRLTRFDHSAYFVGGCVRDLLLDRHPKDFDIGTSATPRQIKQLFRNCRIIGRRFRLAHIYFQNGKIIEVATFRAQDGDEPAADGAASDLLIRDDNQFGTLEQDALRRDFTINSLFYDVENGNVLDHADGLGDLRRGLVRTIGDPQVRFQEDPIRILRAIRFAARLGFEVEGKTLAALRATRHDIPRAAAPRILEEINRLCRRGAARRSFELLREHGVFEVILPELAGAYAESESAWSLLLRLMETIDRRFESGRAAATGQILVVLLLPLLEHRIGWPGNGTSGPIRDTRVRELVDELLRPLAARLRLARKDQEHCRIVISLLARAVHFRNLRRNSRRTLQRRSCLPDALWVLESAATLRGGELAEAAAHWGRSGVAGAKGGDGSGETRSRTTGGDGSGEAGSGEPTRRRRSRRGRGRGRGRADGGTGVEAATATEAEASPPDEQAKGPARGRRRRRGRGEKSADSREPASPAKRESNLPPVWDDDYFFAALPSVPELSGEESVPRRYGELANPEAAGPSETAEMPETAGMPETTEARSESAAGREGPKAPGSRRRSRRRRRPAGRAESDGTDPKPAEDE